MNHDDFLATAEIWDPATDAFNPTGSMATPRFQAAAVLLRDGRVLMLGGNGQGGDTAELFELK